MDELPKVKLSSAERLEAKVKAALNKRDRLLESLDREISNLEARLVKAKNLRESLGGQAASRLAHNQKIVGSNPTPATLSGPLRGFRSNGRLPADPIDAMIREGKIG